MDADLALALELADTADAITTRCFLAREMPVAAVPLEAAAALEAET